MASDFTTVRTEHKDCALCNCTVPFAITMARATGSNRSSYGDGSGHRSTVVRGT